MEATLRWVGFALGVALGIGTVIAVMKTLIVPRRSWSLVAATIGRFGYKAFYGIASRFRRFDTADRVLGFQAPTVIILTLASLLGAFTLAFALMLLPWTDLTIGGALRESGSSVFTLGFVSSPSPIPTTLDVTAGAIGMIFVALTIGYLPSLYVEVRFREVLVKQLEVWAGKPSWGPEILARFSHVDGLDQLPDLFSTWDTWCARVADSHMKYPVLTHFRSPRARNHFGVALLAVADAAALECSLRPSINHTSARLLLRQAAACLVDVTYPMRRIDATRYEPGLTFAEFQSGVDRMCAAGYPIELHPEQAWETFARMRSAYAPTAQQLLYWTIAAPSPWSGSRHRFPEISDHPDEPEEWTIS